LPVPVTRFIGREAELIEIGALLRENRMVTLTGSGGIGKTRTAVEAAAAFHNDAHDTDVWLVELAQLVDATLVMTAVAAAAGVRAVPGRPPLEAARDHLARKKTLLVLDNCEHVIDEAARVCESLLRSCERLRVLATSREPLKISGERTYRLPSFAVPAPDASRLRADELLRFESIALFTERARASNAQFAVSEDSAPLVIEICRRLDGIPLAIELAAARAATIPLKTLAERLERHFDVLAGGARTALPRHQTMGALIDWSYTMLSAGERRVFERFSVFAGGSTLESAVAVCGTAESDSVVLDALSSLSEKSLIVAGPTEARYTMLEVFRQYAREKLAASHELEDAERCHAAFFLALAENLEVSQDTTDQRTWDTTAFAEIENWRAALEWALAAGNDPNLGMRLVALLRTVWTRVAVAEGRVWLRRSRESIGPQTPLEVTALLDLAEATAANNVGDTEAALRASAEAVAGFTRLNDRRRLTRAQLQLSYALVRLGRFDDADEPLRDAVEFARAFGERHFLADARSSVGAMELLRGNQATARAAYAEAVALYNGVGAPQTAAVCEANIAECSLREGDAATAWRYLASSLRVSRGYPERPTTAMILGNAAACLIELGRISEARAHARESLDLAHRYGHPFVAAHAILRLGAIAAAEAREADVARAAELSQRAALLLGFFAARTRLEGVDPTDRTAYDRTSASLEGGMGMENLAVLTSAGARLTDDEAFEEAMLV
jgi:predicted ATPase